ncbi:rho-associated protein kinase 2-like [Camellia sinensis]|uniref:rho-associated protein kinase 2-like n=1 Tax=Camellia sinensis TaxID=4442 RepID=UPI001036D375|nr:rho-associated protein kinase 2-like [Camellia sinensis]
MGRQKAVAKDLLASIPFDIDAQQTQPPPKQKRIKKTQPKAKNREKLAERKREVSSLQKTNRNPQSKMKTLEDQAEVTIKAKDDAEEKVGAAKAINKVLQAQLKEVKDKMVEAQRELQDALATKEAEIKAADEKGYNEGEEVLVRKSKEATGTKSLSLNDQVLDLTQDEEVEEVPKDVTAEKASADVTLADKSLDETLQQIDAKLAVEKAAEMSSQQSSVIQTQPANDAEES